MIILRSKYVREKTLLRYLNETKKSKILVLFFIFF